MKEESMHKKMVSHKITHTEYMVWWLQSKGINSIKEYYEIKARENGYENHAAYRRHYKHTNGIQNSMEDLSSNGVYLGVYIGERILSNIFVDIEKMPYNNPGYDFICNKGKRVNIKCACLHIRKNGWHFKIDHNSNTDYFLCVAFDNINSLTPMHIWFINSKEIINTRFKSELLCNKQILYIPNSQKGLNRFKQYELLDKLNDALMLCRTIREE